MGHNIFFLNNMNISVEYNVDLNYNETFNHKVKFHLGGFELKGEALYENVCDRFDNYNGKAAYSIRHPFPYYLKVSLPYDKEERKAIYKFISSNQDKIRQDYGLVFEFDRVAGDLRGYENECRILGVDVTASTEEIKNKYREQSLKWHPVICFVFAFLPQVSNVKIMFYIIRINQSQLIVC